MSRTLKRELGLSKQQAQAACGAVRAVLEAGDGPGSRGEALLELTAETLELGDWREVSTAGHDELAAAFESPRSRRAMVDALLIPACIEGRVHPAAQTHVQALARELGVRSPWVGLLGPLRRGWILAIKRALVRRSPDARRIFARTWSEEGLGGLLRTLAYVQGLREEPELAARFEALAALPVGSLGRQLVDDLRARGLSLPGRRGGIPERMVHHDLLHVINGYGTDPAGECELAGFYTGHCSHDESLEAFTFIVIVLATFHLGLAVSPAMVHPAEGAFDPARVLAAFLRGRRLRVDVMGPWDYWPLMSLSPAQVRERLGIAT